VHELKIANLAYLHQPTGNYESSEFGELEENPAIQVGDGFSWDNCVFNKTLKQPWETIIFNDRKVKHEAREFVAENETYGHCHRDVIVNFLRKPLLDGSDMKRVTKQPRGFDIDNSHHTLVSMVDEVNESYRGDISHPITIKMEGTGHTNDTFYDGH
jgi:hypothetical protein